MLLTVGYVAAGGALGSALRYLVNVAALRIAPGLPLGTLAVNVLGCAIMGVLATTLAMKGGLRWQPFLLTGVMGGFTTFSAFSLDAMGLWERGQVQAAIAYVGASVILSLLAVLAGAALAKGVLG